MWLSEPGTMYHWCGQEITVQEQHNGYCLWPRFTLDGELLKKCPTCGATLVLDHLTGARPCAPTMEEVGHG